MGLLDRILSLWRERGFLAGGGAKDQPTGRPSHPPPTAGTQIPRRPQPTPTTKPLVGPGTTAGTPRYGGQGSTPSTQRIHNPSHIDR